METNVHKSAGEALVDMSRSLDLIDADRSGLAPETRLSWVRLARSVASRASALANLLAGEADRVQASERTAGTPMASWLGMGETLSRQEAAGAVRQARASAEHPQVAEAAVTGQVGNGQFRAITKVLDGVAPQLNREQRDRAEQVMVHWAGHLDAGQLERSAAKVLAEVAPQAASELLETILQREAEAAYRARSLRFFREGGSVRFDGSLPRVEGEAWISLLDAQGEGLRRNAIEARDPLDLPSSGEQRRADALVALIQAAKGAKPVPGVGSAKVLVKLDYHQLRQGAAGAGLIGEGQELSAGELRQLCCDAELIPAVLAGASEVLDVGRSARLVTSGIRTALTLRDGGCAFPGCDIRPELCEAHHVEPWWAGGNTSLQNLVLLCHHHHGVIEPSKHGTRDQWSVRIADDGLAEFIPPVRMDQQQRPIRNRRHRRSVDPPDLSGSPQLGDSGSPRLGGSGSPRLGDSGSPRLGGSGSARLGGSGSPPVVPAKCLVDHDSSDGQEGHGRQSA